MTTNSKLVRRKQQRIQAIANTSDTYRFFNLLTGPEMLSKVEELLPETYRERQFPPHGNIVDVSRPSAEHRPLMPEDRQ